MTFKKEKGKIRAICFSPEQRKKLTQFKSADKSCTISNI